MSTLRTYNLQNPDSSNVNIELTQGSGAVVAGVTTFSSNVRVSGNLNVDGELTYEDVTNIDSVGIITARRGIVSSGVVTATSFSGNLTGNVTGNVTGNADTATTATNAQGLTGTPNITVGTVGCGNVTSSGSVGIGTDNPRTNFQVGAFGSGSDSNIQLATGTSGASNILFGDGSGGTDYYKGFIKYNHSTDNLELYSTDEIIHYTAGSERLRVDSSGRLLVGPTSTPTPSSVVIQGNSTGSTSYGLLRLTKGSTTPADGDALGLVAFGDSNHNTNAQITSKRDGGTWNSGSSHPTRLEFNTTADGDSGSTERLRITSAGLVGINCTPLAQLQVKAGTNANIALTTMSSEAAIEVFNDAGSANVPLRIRASEHKFFIDGTQRARLSYSSSSAVFSLGDESNSAGHIRLEAKASENQIHGRSNHPIAFLINTSEKLRITSTGDVGINCTPHSNAGINLHIHGDNTTSEIRLTNTTTGTGANGSYIQQGGNTLYIGNSESGNTVFEVNGSEALRINSSGYVQIQPNGSGDLRLQFGGNGTRLQNTTAGGHIDLYTNNAVRNRFLYNGQGTEFSNQNRVIPTTDNAVDLGSSGARWDDVYATNGTIQTSDSRLKQEVETSVLGIDFVKALRPVSYKWIEGKKVAIVDNVDENGDNVYRTDADNNWVYDSRDGARKHWGFIAQEVKQAVDDAGVDFAGWTLADKDDPDSTQSLRYEEFIAPLTKALQEVIAKNEALEARIAVLEG